MLTVINHVTEPTTRLGSDILIKETVELAGHHYIAVSTADGLKMLDIDTCTTTDIAPAAAYTVIDISIAASNNVG